MGQAEVMGKESIGYVRHGIVSHSKGGKGRMNNLESLVEFRSNVD